MKPLYATLLIIFAWVQATPAQATFSLRVGDPRVTWNTKQGTIEEAVLSVRPLGVYWEYGLYLTFSARGNGYAIDDSLEVALQFELPAQAIIHDSWLWIGDDIVRAKILDKWTASQIYENIVARRQDPSILFKKSAIQYELRVFPMAGQETRKVKISFLMPTQWHQDEVLAALPTKILQTSKYTVPKLSLLTWPDADWVNPGIEGHAEIGFLPLYDSIAGAYYQADLGPAYYNQVLNLSFSAPLQNGYFLRVNNSGGEGIYQLAVLPWYFIGTGSAKKVAVLVDYEAGGGAIDPPALLASLKTKLLGYLNPTDSFNLIFSKLPILRASDTWLPADPVTIEATFSSIGNSLASYSNLTPLLADGIDFIQENGNTGQILLVTNSSQNGTAVLGNDLLEDILALMDPLIPVQVVDYRTAPAPVYSIGGITYHGSAYFLFHLSKVTGGSFHQVRQGQVLDQALANGFAGVEGIIELLDLHTSMENGFCYGRFTVAPNSSNFINHREPLLQVGKYAGQFPFRFQLAGEWNQTIFNEQIEVPAAAILPADTLLREMWYGRQLQSLEAQTPANNAIINEIISGSLSERILSLYTAFLCLEDTTQICDECEDETQLVDVQNPETGADTALTAYPNPFNDRVTLSIKASALGSRPDQAVLTIYAVDGRTLRSFTGATGGDWTVIWDGRDAGGRAAPPGLYLATLKTERSTTTLKLIRRE